MSGKSPDAIMPKSSSAQSLNVICCRDGVRISPRLVWRVTTPMTGAGPPPRGRSRTIGTARTRVGVSSNQSGDAESTIAPVAKASLTWARHCGRTRSPTMSR